MSGWVLMTIVIPDSTVLFGFVRDLSGKLHFM